MTESPNRGRSSGITVLVIFGIAILSFAATLFITWQLLNNTPEPGPTSSIATTGAGPTVVETEPEG